MENDEPGLSSRKGDGRHTPSSLADVLERDYFPMPDGAKLYLSEYEWRIVVDALRAVRSERPFIPEVIIEALKEVCYQPGHYKAIEDKNYCRWCGYVEGHAHGDDCAMKFVEQSSERKDS